ncbi:MAG: sulfotransferase [Bacteroidetes bacterium]|nr:sulfotransferase [Bacteroidota bacterium]
MRRTRFRYPVTTLAGSTLKNIIALNKSHHVEKKYRLKFQLSAATAAFFEIFNLVERVIWQKRLTKLRPQSPPVFIIGFWRSGTTLLHNLLCQDPEAAYVTTFQTVFPNLMLTQSWWLKPLTNLFLPEKRPFDNVRMDMDFPQEEEFGMMNIQPHTLYKFFLYPAEFDRILEKELFTDKLPETELSKWKKDYSGMIAKAIFSTGGKRYIGKNPCNLTRIRLLKEMYPEAKFIFIHRDPYQVIESLYRFTLSIFPGVQLQDLPEGFGREKVARLYQKIMDTYLADRKKLSSSDLIEISMEEFIADKKGTLETIYKTFQLGDFNRALPGIEKFLSENPCPVHESYEPSPETRKLVNQYASTIASQLGYKVYQPVT